MIRRYILTLSILLLFTVLSKGQEKYDFIWVFSQNSSLTQGNEASILSFKNGKISIDSINIDNQMGLNNSSFSNGLGDLVLYSNACEIYDSTYQVVENGSGINPGEVHDNWCDIGEYPAYANSLFFKNVLNASSESKARLMNAKSVRSSCFFTNALSSGNSATQALQAMNQHFTIKNFPFVLVGV